MTGSTRLDPADLQVHSPGWRASANPWLFLCPQGCLGFELGNFCFFYWGDKQFTGGGQERNLTTALFQEVTNSKKNISWTWGPKYSSALPKSSVCRSGLTDWFTKAKRKLQALKYFEGSPVCIVWYFFAVQFSLWICLSLVQSHPCDDGRSSQAQRAWSSGRSTQQTHSFLIYMDQGLWTKRAGCPAPGAGGSHPGLSSSTPSSQHTGGSEPVSCSPSFYQWGENRTDKNLLRSGLF